VEILFQLKWRWHLQNDANNFTGIEKIKAEILQKALNHKKRLLDAMV